MFAIIYAWFMHHWIVNCWIVYRELAQLWKKWNTCTLHQKFDGFNVWPLIFSDSAYPSIMGQIKPFPFRQNWPQHQKVLNGHLSSARVTVERTSGVLKVRFRILMKRMDVDLDNAVIAIITYCVLSQYMPKKVRSLYRPWWNFRKRFNKRALRRGHRKNQNCPDADLLEAY